MSFDSVLPRAPLKNLGALGVLGARKKNSRKERKARQGVEDGLRRTPLKNTLAPLASLARERKLALRAQNPMVGLHPMAKAGFIP